LLNSIHLNVFWQQVILFNQATIRQACDMQVLITYGQCKLQRLLTSLWINFLCGEFIQFGMLLLLYAWVKMYVIILSMLAHLLGTHYLTVYETVALDF